MSKETDSKTAVIEPAPNGPYLVKNPPTLKNSKGETLETKPVTALCRCGRSDNKPFCDGTHAKVGFSSERIADGSTDKQDHYEGKAITINDNRGVCAHSARCTDGLKSVFKYGEEPWIDPDGADLEAIKKQVRECPSGALSYTMDGVEHDRYHHEAGIGIVKNGPYRVFGGIELVEASAGRKPQSRDHYTLCRCGGSKNKPFCDGTHWKGFKDDKN
jgi:CDGSH-type Zn-finger protein